MFGWARESITLLQKYLQFDRYETKKVLFSGITFFCIIGAYSILRSLKTSIFLGFVGREYEPIVKMAGIFITIPAMLIHAKVIDRYKKHQAVYAFLGFYAILVTFFAFIFAHPSYGVANTQTSPYRLVGWAFEVSMDIFQALVVGTFWSFINSISTPLFAEKGYGLIVACSRIGGISTTALSWYLLEKTLISSEISIPLVTALAAALLGLGMFCIYLVSNKIPESELHGYQATYDTDQKTETAHSKTGIFEGLLLMLKQPYVLAIFTLVFSYEVINIIFDYQMHVLMSIEANNKVSAMSSFMFFYTGSFQVLSLIFALFGTSTLLKRLGIRYSLFVMPVAIMILAFLPVFCPKLIVIFCVMVVLRALNYGFNHPLREMLFIPTTKDIRFKSKAWLESFGRTISKTSGSTFNMFVRTSAPLMCITIESFLALGLSAVWLIVAYFVGRIYTKTVENNEVIGNKSA